MAQWDQYKVTDTDTNTNNDWSKYAIKTDSTVDDIKTDKSKTDDIKVDKSNDNKSNLNKLSDLWDKVINSSAVDKLLHGSESPPLTKAEADEINSTMQGKDMFGNPFRQFKEGDKRQIIGPKLMSIPPLDRLANKIKDYGQSSGNYWGGFAGSIGKDLIDMASSGFDPRTVFTKKSPMDLFPILNEESAAGKQVLGRAPVQAGEATTSTPSSNTSKLLMKDGSIIDPIDVEEHLNNRPDLVPVGDEINFNDLRYNNPVDLTDKTFNLASERQNMGRPNLSVDEVNKLFSNPAKLEEGTTINFKNKASKLNSNEPRVTSLKPATPELIKQAQAKGPDIIHLKTADKTQLENAAQYGYKFEGVNSDGSLRLRKNAIDLDELDYNSRVIAQDNAVKIAQSANKNGSMSFSDLMKMTENSIGKPTPEQLEQIRKNGIEPINLVLKRNSIDNPKSIGIYDDNYGTSGEFTLDQKGHQTLAAAKALGIKEIPVKIAGKLRKSINPEATTSYTRMYDRKTGKLISSNESNIPPNEPLSNNGGNNGDEPPPNDNNGHIGNIVNRRKATIAQEVLNLPRGIMASWDLSAPFRQGLGLIHRPEWWKSWGSMFKSFGSENAFRAVQDSIANKPLFKQFEGQPSFAEKAGLKLTDLTDLNNREEQIMSTWAEKIPGVRPSNRAYTAFLNKLRADSFESLMDSYKILNKTSGEYNMPLAQQLAGYVNTATGRGSLGPLEKYARALNSILFSPRLIASRLQLISNPVMYMTSSGPARNESIKSLLAIAGTGALVSQLGKLAGGTVENDPTSSDFGKLKIGNTRIDPYGGFQQYIVAANRLLQGRTVSSVSGRESELNSGKFGSQTKFDVAERFGESKLNPLIGLAITILRGKNLAGQKVDLPEEVASKFVPLFIQDLKNVATENPNLIPGYKDLGLDNINPARATLALPGAVGFGIQNYPSR